VFTTILLWVIVTGSVILFGLIGWAIVMRYVDGVWFWVDVSDDFTEDNPDDDDWVFGEDEDDEDDDDDEEFDEEWDNENLADKSVNNFWTGVMAGFSPGDERIHNHTAIADTVDGVEFVEVMPDHYSDDYFANQMALNETDMLLWEKERLQWLLEMRYEAYLTDRELASV
jgi:hypothetical protein